MKQGVDMERALSTKVKLPMTAAQALIVNRSYRLIVPKRLVTLLG